MRRFYYRYPPGMGQRRKVPLGLYARAEQPGRLTLEQARAQAQLMEEEVLRARLASARGGQSALRQVDEGEVTPLKRCTSCGQLRGLGLFAWKNKTLGTRHARCKICLSGRNKQRYEANKEAYIAKAARHNTRYRERGRTTVAAYLAKHVCVDCGADNSQGDLVPYCGGSSAGFRPVWEVLKHASSAAAIDAALSRSLVLCGRCLHLRTAAKNAWAAMNHEERDASKWSIAKSSEEAVAARRPRRR